MAHFLASMTASKRLQADLLAIRNARLARLARGRSELGQRRLATRATRDNIWRSWTMCWSFILRMTLFFTRVFSAVESPSTDDLAVERTCPLLHHPFIKSLQAILLLSTLATYDRFFDLATVAAGVNTNFACTTESLMTGTLTGMLATGHEVATDLLATPTARVIRIDAAT